MIVEILPIARDDVDQALIYIAADDPAAADRLYDDILEKLNQVSQHPYSAPEITIGRRVYRRVYVHPYNLAHLNFAVFQCFSSPQTSKPL